MKPEKQVASLEPSKRLAELGVRVESFWTWKDNADGVRIQTSAYLAKFCDSEYYPAYTVAELGEMLYSHTGAWVSVEQWHSCGGYDFGIIAEYNNDGKPVKGSQFICETEADARAKMLIWLISEGHIDVDKDINMANHA